MANSVAIPQDIINSVIVAVGNDEYSLQQCALVSSSFLLPSRKQLFSKISLSSNQSFPRLNQFLIQNPVIQSFVKKVDDIQYCRSKCDLNSTSLLAILRLPFCCLESFSISVSEPWSWNSFSSELKDALSNIIHSPTLNTLCLREVVNVPITLFLGIVHLTKLELAYFPPEDFDGERSSSLTQAASKGLATTISHPVIDQCLWHFTERVRGPTGLIFLPFMCRLRLLEISVQPNSAIMRDSDTFSVLMRSLCISLTSPATLERLKFTIWFFASDNHFNFEAFCEDLRDADFWSHLDSIITHPAGSRLQRVDIGIEYIADYDVYVPAHLASDNNEILEAVLGGLPLLREKGVLFVEATIDE